MKRLTITYCGNFEPRHSTETHIARTLEEDLGHRVIRLQENETPVETIFQMATNVQSDLFLYTRTWGLEGDGMALLRDLEAVGIPTASYHLDLYWGIERQNTMPGDPFWNTKYVFTPDGGAGDAWEKAGINHFYIRPGVFRKECYVGSYRPEFYSEVGFVGALDGYHPEWIGYRRQLKAWLQDAYGDRFDYWPKDQPAVRNEDLNNLYASVKVVVGDSLCMGFTHPYYWSDRVYETLGRGGFIIHPFIKGLEEEFTDGENIVLFQYNDWDGLQEKIDFYLNHADEREQIRVAGQEFVRKNCTYTNRLMQALEIIGGGEGW